MSELFGEPAVLFKEKINYKYPGTGAYPAHKMFMLMILLPTPSNLSSKYYDFS